jgi:hypothetical protein
MADELARHGLVVSFGTLFVARVGSFGAQTDAATLSAGFQLAFLGAAALALLGSVLALLIIRTPKPTAAPVDSGKELATAGPRTYTFSLEKRTSHNAVA